MSRFALVCVLGACAALAPAAPVPHPVVEKERVAEMWGETAGAGEFEARGKQLTIRSAPLLPDFHSRGPFSFPHTLREARGNFAVTTHLVELSEPTERDVGDTHGSYAGLYATDGGHGVACLVLDYRPGGAKGPAAAPKRGLYLAEWNLNRACGSKENVLIKPGTVRLRLIRSGNVLALATSADGATWSEPHPLVDEMPLADTVWVGVVAGTMKQRTVCATFADLTIEPLKPEPKK